MTTTATLLLTTIVALAPPNNSVTIQTSRPSVIFGNNVSLSGKVSSGKSGEKVNVIAEPFGAASFDALASVDTTGGGNWSYVAKPTIETTYEAHWQGQTSTSVTVKVRPAIKLSLVSASGGTGTFSTTVTGARSFVDKFVLLQRVTATGSATLKKVTLNSSSSATFHARLHKGRSRLRVVMPTSQTSPGYITGLSNVLTVKR